MDTWLNHHLGTMAVSSGVLSRPLALVTALLLCASISGCERSSEQQPAQARPVITDSAGVRLVTIPGDTQFPQRVSVDSRPFLVLGGLDESEHGELDLKTPWLSAVALQGGTVAVNETSGVKLFSSRGRFQSVIGKAGMGPGEFAQVREVCALSDNSFMAIDFPSQKRTIVASTGQVERVIRTDGAIPVGACDSAGTVLLRLPSDGSTRVGDRPVSAYRLLSLDDEWLSGRIEIQRALAAGPISFEQSFQLVGARIVVADPESGTISIFSREGALVSQLRLSTPLIPVTDAQWDSLVLWAFPAQYNPPELRRRLIERARVLRPLNYPAFGRVWADSAANAWIQDYANPSRFTVVNLSGEMLGRLELPSGRMTRLASDHVVIRDFDRDGAAILRFHRIRYR